MIHQKRDAFADGRLEALSLSVDDIFTPRKAWSREDAIEYICTQAGVQFDPRIVECFLGLIKKTA